MLLNLHVRDFVIVDECALDLAAGFTVFSGETGAGKSILIDALALVLGERADAGMVREGAQKADVSATFSTHASLDAWLDQHEFQGDEGVLLLRRTIDAQGKSRGFINGAPATQALLREAGDFLVDIHGQHAHQQLLRAAAQRNLLDNHAGLAVQAAQVATAYRQWQAIVAQRAEFERNARNLSAERERLQWQVDDLQRLVTRPGEWLEISTEHQRLAHAAGLIEGVQIAVDTLSNDDTSVQSALAQVLTRLRPLAEIDATLRNGVEALDGAEAAIADAVSTLHGYLGRIELDPQRVEALDARMQALHGAARKYRCTPEQLPAELASATDQLALLSDAADLEALARKEAHARVRFDELAAMLTMQRKQAATQLSREVTRAMQDLAMTGGSFEVALTVRSEPAAHGLEDVEFLVAAHPGVAPRPLAKVASGGELARISLAIAVIAASANATPTLIFDEVDAGIGGAVAEVVGGLLRQLGQSRQVLCVTHLPQVAAQGDQHFAVSKVTRDNGEVLRTVSNVESIAAAERVEEIARMLGGVELTTATRKAAREMLTRRNA
jgi:DNA repair protein RecN (Recombination protein N)